MKKTFLILIVPTLFFIFAGCGENNCMDRDELLTDDTIAPDENGFYESENENDDENAVPDEDAHGDPPSYNWIAPDPDWESWAYLRMTGKIADSEGEHVEATFAEGKIKIAKGITDLDKGSFLSQDGLVFSANAVNYEFLNVDEEKGTATVDYYDANWNFSKQLIPVFIEEKINEVDFGAFMTFRNSMIDVNFDSNGAITDQRLRKNCWLAVAATEEIEEAGETYEIAVGGIYGCFDCASTGSVGETLKMMFRNELTDKREDLLKWINTQQDESALEYGDEGFQFECVCYEESGIDEVPCWQYDGPGGAEECPPEVPEGKCYPESSDEDTIDDDEIQD
ncbi:MAG TPA: hypothetical protein VLJ60_02810 [bacterium]|nr:hypothetical protein [bacterium]